MLAYSLLALLSLSKALVLLWAELLLCVPWRWMNQARNLQKELAIQAAATGNTIGKWGKDSWCLKQTGGVGDDMGFVVVSHQGRAYLANVPQN